MEVTLKTSIRKLEIKESEKPQCAVIKTADGNIYIMPDSVHRRWRRNIFDALRNAEFVVGK
ncbi:MAG: hypothetical protein ACXABY_29235 [Candidatus Thorarchaeota archaeon]|jgi:hypothetical protein